MQRDMSHKTIVTTFPLPLCPNMKYHKLENVLNALVNNVNEIQIKPDVFKKAAQTIIRMFEITEPDSTKNTNLWEGPRKQVVS